MYGDMITGALRGMFILGLLAAGVIWALWHFLFSHIDITIRWVS